MATITEEARVLMFAEAETLIKNLKLPSLKHIGSVEWQRYHEYVEKLNMQALLSADSKEDEYVMELINTHGKLELLIRDLLSIEVWKTSVFPIIRRTNFKPDTTIPLYMVLYHEATIVNLLETLFFHQESVEAAEEVCIDLLDYCYRNLTGILRRKHDYRAAGDDATVNTIRELCKQSAEIDFEVAVKSVSIVRYMTDCLESLPLSVATRMLKTLNLPHLMVELIQNSPWIKRDGSLIQKFVDGKWEEVKGGEIMKMSKTEAQAWLAIYNLMSPAMAAKYDFNDFNKTHILKLRSHLNDVVVDQLPILIDFRRYLEHLAIMETPPPQSDLVLEQLPEIRDRILKDNEGKFEAIAKHQMIKYFNPTKKQIKEQAKRLAQTYDYEMMDSLIKEIPHCANCGAEATKRCSRCRQEWYCGRECQVAHWKKHKSICDVYMMRK